MMSTSAYPHVRTVAILAYEGMSTFEIGIVTEIFGLHWPDLELHDDWYDVKICAERAGVVNVVGGAELRTSHGLDVLASAQTLVAPRVGDVRGDPSPEVIAALRLAHRRGSRIVSICSGVFTLAAAGLLDGLQATTHWRYIDLLQNRYPAINVDSQPLYIDNDPIFTSAGCAAGIDLCLYLVRKDFGVEIENRIARQLVISSHQKDGQSQYIEAPLSADLDDERIAESISWALDHLTENISVDILAKRAHMSNRTYLRHFSRCVGSSPIKWLIGRRIQASLPLLETTGIPIEQIATRVGFDTAATYRYHFSHTMRISPSAYRRKFRS